MILLLQKPNQPNTIELNRRFYRFSRRGVTWRRKPQCSGSVCAHTSWGFSAHKDPGLSPALGHFLSPLTLWVIFTVLQMKG